MSILKDENSRFRFYKFIIYFISLGILTFICGPNITKKFQNIKVGNTAEIDIIAPRNIEIEDTKAEDELKKQIFENLKNIYKIETPVINIDDTFVAGKIPDIEEFKQKKILDESNRLLNKIYDKGYTDKPFEEKDYQNGITVTLQRTNSIHTFERSPDQLKQFEDSIIIGYDSMVQYIKEKSNIQSKFNETLISIITSVIRPNITIDNERIMQEYYKKIETLQPQKITIKKNELIVKKGELINLQTADILNKINTYQFTGDINLVIIIFFTFLVILLFINYYFYFFIKTFNENIYNYIVLFMLLIIPAFILKFYLVLVNSSLFADKLFLYIFLVPIESSAILSVMLLFNRTGIIVSMLTSFISALVFAVYSPHTYFNDPGYSFLLGFTVFFSSMTGVIFMSRAKRRTNLLKSGFFISLTNIVFLFIAEKLYSKIFSVNLEIEFLAYIIIFVKGLLLTPSFVTGFMPFFESLFNLTTEYRLLELSDISNPLLKELATKAPGTYQHSLTVANLAESAAQAIGANPLIARVGSYYHDIGKIFKPNYFIENQNYMENPHNFIKPSLSNSVLKAHVKQGLELADKWKLPKPIKDIIQQHHGKSLMVYFYNVALKTEENVSEQEYRYGGPSPDFRESAIISIADSIEAMTRTLKNPTPARIEDMVSNAIKKKIADGDLDNCELTLKEIQKISEVFTRILTTMYHTRIEYPDSKELKSNEELSKKSESQKNTIKNNE